MQQFAVFVLVVWLPITIGLFTVMPPRKATVTSLVAGWLLLPSLSIALPGIPDYSKITATTLGILAGTALFDTPRLLAFRPRWFDLPMLTYCLCPFAASISNGDGAYDGVSQSLFQFFLWGFPYLIGRIYFNDLEGLRELTIGVIIGGCAYIIPCLYEIRMSPMLSYYLYGATGWGGMRLGGYRPKVFLRNGLELGTWMCAASLAAWWVWRSGYLKQLAGIQFGRVLLPTLLVTNILCRSSGALVLFMMGVVTLWGSVRFKTKGLLICVILLTPAYYAIRIKGYWSGEVLVDAIRNYLDEERAESVDFRFRNENLMIERSLERPIIGWGGYGRFLAVDPEKLRAEKLHKQAVPDGLWVIALGQTGFIGLASMTLAMLLPPILFLRRFSTDQWLDPLIAPAAMFSVLLSIYMLDCLANAMLNLIYIVSMGGLIAAVPPRTRFDLGSPTPASANRHASPPDDNRIALPAIVSKADTPSYTAEHLARRYADLGRSLAQQGRRNEARSSWFQALDLWNRLASAHPETPRFLSSRCDCCNDLAWFLLNQPEVASEDMVQAVAFATMATEAFPDRSDYWNTLGAAYYRAGDDRSAVEALHRSLFLQGDQGTAFDYFYLSLVCSRLEQHDIARSWYHQGCVWVEEHALDRQPLQALGDEARERLAHFERSESSI